MEKLEFAIWWKEFIKSHKDDKDGGIEAIKHLKNIVSEFNTEKKTSFIDQLILNDKPEIASELIELYGSKSQKEFIRNQLLECIKRNDYNMLSFSFLKTVINTYQEDDYNLLKLYYDKQPLFNRVIPTELFDIDKNLFLFAFQKMIIQYPEYDIYEYDGLLYLTNRLDILEFLIDNLDNKHACQIQKFCKVKSSHSYINRDDWKQKLLSLAEKTRI